MGMMLCVLFSGQVLANSKGHAFYQIPNADHVLRHCADSDEIRIRTQESAEELRQFHILHHSRKPATNRS